MRTVRVIGSTTPGSGAAAEPRRRAVFDLQALRFERASIDAAIGRLRFSARAGAPLQLQRTRRVVDRSFDWRSRRTVSRLGRTSANGGPRLRRWFGDGGDRRLRVFCVDRFDDRRSARAPRASALQRLRGCSLDRRSQRHGSAIGSRNDRRFGDRLRDGCSSGSATVARRSAATTGVRRSRSAIGSARAGARLRRSAARRRAGRSDASATCPDDRRFERRARRSATAGAAPAASAIGVELRRRRHRHGRSLPRPHPIGVNVSAPLRRAACGVGSQFGRRDAARPASRSRKQPRAASARGFGDRLRNRPRRSAAAGTASNRLGNLLGSRQRIGFDDRFAESVRRSARPAIGGRGGLERRCDSASATAAGARAAVCRGVGGGSRLPAVAGESRSRCRRRRAPRRPRTDRRPAAGSRCSTAPNSSSCVMRVGRQQLRQHAGHRFEVEPVRRDVDRLRAHDDVRPLADVHDERVAIGADNRGQEGVD